VEVQQSLEKRFDALSSTAQVILKVCAVFYHGIKRSDLINAVRDLDVQCTGGKRLTEGEVRIQVRQLSDAQDLISASKNARLFVVPELVDYAVQRAVCDNQLQALADVVKAITSNQSHVTRRSYDSLTVGQMRIGFYSSDDEILESIRYGSVPLVGTMPNALGVLSPFDPKAFAKLGPMFQEQYLCEAGAETIVSGNGTPDLLAALERASQTDSPSEAIVTAVVDMYTAQGNLAGLRALDKRLSGDFPEVLGCEAFLKGQWGKAQQYFDAAVAKVRGGKKRAKKKDIAGHMASIFHVLLLLRNASAVDRKLATTLLDASEQKWQRCFCGVRNLLFLALTAQENATSVMGQYHDDGTWTGLESLVFSLFLCWFDPSKRTTVDVTKLESIRQAYQTLEYDYLDAEATWAHSFGAGSAQLAADSTAMHGRLKTVGLKGFIEATPPWKRTLIVLSQLESPSSEQAESGGESQRLIWGLSYSLSHQWISPRPILQKRTKSGEWTNGRPVALQRLYCDGDKYEFLTAEDRRLCRCIREESYSTGRGRYTETIYTFDSASIVSALPGHPAIFRDGDRARPLEIVACEPNMVVSRSDSSSIHIRLEPAPQGTHNYVLVEDGPHRLNIVSFSPRHLRIHKLLGKELVVPATEEGFVVQSLQSLASLLPIQSELGGIVADGARVVETCSQPQLHVSPFEEGIRAEFFVQPFGELGPYFRPGSGSEHVSAAIQEESRSVHRELETEREMVANVLAVSPTLASQLPDYEHGHGGEELAGEFSCVSAVESLELLLELQPAVEAGKLKVHWPHGEKFGVRGEATASQFRLNLRKERDWFAASGELKFDKNLKIDMMQLVELVETSPSRFIELTDGSFLALTMDFKRRIEEFAAFSDRTKKNFRVLPIRAAAMESMDDSFVVKADKHWLDWMRQIRESGEIHPVIPSTFQGELRDYQREAFTWMNRLAHWGAGGCLADDMGLGKTVVALATLVERATGGPALVVAPTSVAFNWENEAAKFAPTLRVRVFGDGDRDACFADLGPMDVLICSYSLMQIESERFQDQHWNTVILDEAQAIKNVATKRSQAAMKLSASFRLIMTGTPLENHLGELWNLLEFVNPGLLGSYDSFQRRFAVPIERDRCRETRRQLKRLIQPFILRRTKTQVLDELPSRTEMTLWVQMDSKEAALYEALRQRAVEKLAEDMAGDDPSHLKVLAEIMRLRRACCHPSLALRGGTKGSGAKGAAKGSAATGSSATGNAIEGAKLTAFSRTIDELLSNHHKILVFSQFVDHLSLLRKVLDDKNVSYQYLDGSTTTKQRKVRVEAFQAGEGDIFLISLKAGGVGLNLTAADYVIHMDPWWNPAVEDQASDRAHRLGQKRPVTIYRMITKGTIEERIIELHQTKRDLADSLLEGTDISGKQTTEQLLRLIAEPR
jgi:superfamily II DNA or RNA helicase